MHLNLRKPDCKGPQPVHAGLPILLDELRPAKTGKVGMDLRGSQASGTRKLGQHHRPPDFRHDVEKPGSDLDGFYAAARVERHDNFPWVNDDIGFAAFVKLMGRTVLHPD
jgi:hypothetical protein